MFPLIYRLICLCSFYIIRIKNSYKPLSSSFLRFCSVITIDSSVRSCIIIITYLTIVYVWCWFKLYVCTIWLWQNNYKKCVNYPFPSLFLFFTLFLLLVTCFSLAGTFFFVKDSLRTSPFLLDIKIFIFKQWKKRL